MFETIHYQRQSYKKLSTFNYQLSTFLGNNIADGTDAPQGQHL